MEKGLLIYVPKLTNRVGYTLNVLFKNILQVDFSITTNAGDVENYPGAVISYGPKKVGDSLFVKSSDLLFATTIESQALHCFESEGMKAIFPVHGVDIDFEFDVFAASFYLISRYEEYLPHRKDEHGRFSASQSIAFKEGFLKIPIVNVWMMKVLEKLMKKFPYFQSPVLRFSFENTIDVDAAYCYRNKGLLRTLSGSLKDLVSFELENVTRRWEIVLGKKTDPFDTFDYILQKRNEFHVADLTFFILLGDYAAYDKNIDCHNPDFQSLIKHLGDYAHVGIHPSYASYGNPKVLMKEVQRLEEILHRKIEYSRNHFLRLSIPYSYRMLGDLGVLNDYTMGYADEEGFRAGICTPYPFFDLEYDLETPLMIHPFAVMDATLRRYKGYSVEEGVNVMKELIDEVAKVNGTFSSIWHNESLSDDFEWKGWRKVFEEMMECGSSLMK